MLSGASGVFLLILVCVWVAAGLVFSLFALHEWVLSKEFSIKSIKNWIKNYFDSKKENTLSPDRGCDFQDKMKRK